ncbi:guanine deaminase [Aquabacterium commune]|uniref:Guanine deaminase n=1 Tax=Aquabacterium commune TaxID=70586 RepID=A0A4R6R868_9BURK|nr:guanine deaminase [Aquabacterium commune]TDP82210.1 guanine deaminase [Aquabacterium commune]
MPLATTAHPASQAPNASQSPSQSQSGHAAPERLVLRADVLDFTADPGFAPPAEAPGVRWRPDHRVCVEAGRIVAVLPAAQALPEGWASVPEQDHRGRLLLPGFIDTHVHCPQLDVIASHGAELLDWLNTCTFPAERRYADPAVSCDGAERFLKALWAHGTTSAVVFPTVHKVSAEALFEAADAQHMRLVTGKVLMDRFAPEGLLDDAADVTVAERDCADLIARWHGRGRLAYAVTVRFAATSTPAQLAMAGRLCHRHAGQPGAPGVFMQTHVAENRAEVDWVMSLFPEARSYLGVYERAGLLGPRAVLAHGIWLDAEDRAVLRAHGAQIAHCPSSNLFLGSGLFDWAQAQREGLRVSLASDVGGGTSLCLLRNMGDAYKIQALQGTRLSAWKALHAATLGAAEALGLGSEIGRIEPGCMADIAVWDWAVGEVARHRDAIACEAGDGSVATLHPRAFAWMTLGDERNLVGAWVAGRQVFARET